MFIGKRALSALIDLLLSVHWSWSPGPGAGLQRPVRLVRTVAGGPRHPDRVRATRHGRMATCFVIPPLVVREVVPVLEELGDDQEQAAQPGANAWQTFWRITLPASSGRRCTAWCSSPARAPSVSSGRSRSSPATSAARPRSPPSRPAEVPELRAADGVLRVVPAGLRPCCAWSSSRCSAPRKARNDEYRGQGSQQAVLVTCRAGRRQRLAADRSAHRTARTVGRRQVDAAADHRGLDAADEGSVTIEGIEATTLPPQKRNVGFCVPALRRLQAHDGG